MKDTFQVWKIKTKKEKENKRKNAQYNLLQINK